MGVFNHDSQSQFSRSPQGTPGTMTCFLCPKIPGGTSRKIGRGCAAHFLKPLPYFRPKSAIFPTLFQTWSPERVTSCHGTYTVVGVNIKRETRGNLSQTTTKIWLFLILSDNIVFQNLMWISFCCCC